MPTYWQVAAGSEGLGRDFEDQFFRYGMAFVGGKKQSEAMSKVTKGDVMILKRGLKEIRAVGEVVALGNEGKVGGNGDKAWLKDFDGWDLGSYCYVDWWRKPVELTAPGGFAISTITKTVNILHIALARQILAGDRNIEPRSSEPKDTKAVDDEEVLRFLIQEGLRPSAADDLTDTFRRIRLLAKYYYYDYPEIHWYEIREHETRSFLILPLLLALGWAEQQMKVEVPVDKGRGRVDIACFARPYHLQLKDTKCVVLIEAKAFGVGLDYAPDQAKRYAKEYPSCKVLVVSNGYCYKAYPRGQDGNFSKKPSAYLNILSPKDAYPLDPVNVKGALELFKLLMPISLR